MRKKNKSKIIAALAALFIYSFSSAQVPLPLSGTILEEDTSLPVIQAAIQLLSVRDSASVVGTVTDNDGHFTLRANAGDYIVKISCLGFTTEYRNIHLTHSAGGMELSDIRLALDSEVLESAKVTAQAPITSVVADTVVYNPAAMRLSEDAMLEDLLKKIPGLEIQGETIMLQGRPISELLINGEHFFAGNIRAGLQSLSADMIEKIHAYEKESDFARITGIDDGEEVPVLDIKIKKDMLEGWKGNINTGYGTDQRYTARLNANKIKKDYQRTIMAGANNLNGNISMNDASRTQLGGGSGGNNDKREGGFTFTSKSKTFKVNGNVHYNGNHKESTSDSEAEHIVSSGNYFTTSNGESINNGNTPKGDFTLEWNPTSQITILSKPKFNSTISDSFSHTIGGNYMSDPEGLGDEEIRDIIKTSTNNYSNNITRKYSGTADIHLTYRFPKKKGRTISFIAGGTMTSNITDQGTDYYTRYYRYKSNPDSSLSRKMYTGSNSDIRSWFSQISYNEPLGKGFHFQTTLRYDHSRTHNIRDVYDLAESGWSVAGFRRRTTMLASLPSDLAACHQDAFSSDAVFTSGSVYHQMSIRYVRKKFNFTLGEVMRRPVTRLEYYEDGELQTHITPLLTVSPHIRLEFKPKKSKKLSFTYKTSPARPSVYDLMPVSNGTNPLYQHIGNPDLETTTTHTANLQYNRSNIKKQNSLICNATFNLYQNSISNSTIYDPESGGRTVTPMNINGKWNASGSLVYNKTFGDGSFSISEHLSGRYDNNVAYLYNSKLKADEINTATRAMIKESFEGNYRNDWLELTMSLRGEATDEKSLLRPNMNQQPYTLGTGVTALFIFPWKMRLTTTYALTAQRGFAYAEFNRNYHILNLSLSQVGLKKKATFKIEACDVLHQLPNITRSFTSEKRSITQYNGVNSYILARFIYRFNH
ncbi:MAG: TonB-dependent receptor [Bacteroidales bacterium]|nr:TonB-dependent receptor [Bacteroidales bacterium]